MNPLESFNNKIKIKPEVGEQKHFKVVIHQVKIVKKIDADFDRNAFFDRMREKKLDIVVAKPESIRNEVERNEVERNKRSEVGRVTIGRSEAERSEVGRVTIGRSEVERNKRNEMSKMSKTTTARTKLIIVEPTGLFLKLMSDEIEESSVDKKRRTKPTIKGTAILSPELAEYFDDSSLKQRLPPKSPSVLVKAPAYYLNNREIFINFINTLFKPYHDELKQNKDAISCDTIGLSNGDFSLLTHQKLVRDYMNLYTPYRGLLLYHGLGSGKTCTSIAIAEGMKHHKKVIVLTPASLRMNYMEELKKCGDLIYKKNQYWEWISATSHPEMIEPIAKILNISKESIRKRRGAWFVNVKKKSNYSEMSNDEKKTLDAQLNEMIDSKYTFIHYNGIRTKRLGELTNDFTTNLFDNAVVIVDEAHNLISRIVNKIKKEKDIDEDEQGEKAHAPKHLASKLYEYLLSAKNAKIVLLTGTPVINYPNEFGILFNILRGYIKTWKITLDVKTKSKVDKESLYKLLMVEKSLDYLEYSPASSVLTLTRNPFGFKNKIKKESGYKGITNEKKDVKGDEVLHIDNSFISDEEFIAGIKKLLGKHEIKITKVVATNKKALPDDFELFSGHYIDANSNTLKNADSLKRRIIGLSSFFKSAQESLLPRYDELPGKDYHIVETEMSDAQFKLYEAARAEERKTEKPPSKKGGNSDLYKEQMSTYRIFSRLFCNYAMPDRPKPAKAIVEIQTETKKLERNLDLNNDREGEVEGDEILETVGDVDYKVRVEQKLEEIRENPGEFLSKDALQTHSPKFLHLLENITDEANVGLHLVYSQFRTLEGVGLFSLVLEANGFARFKIKKTQDSWILDIAEEDLMKPKYALYTGTETAEEKEIIRNIYNGDWNYVPSAIVAELTKKSQNNNLGEICKILMITSSGSEGINLRNTRFVHIMEPYWHPVRSEQVIGRARRICSHKNLPAELQTVEVFVYLMKFSEKQLASNDAIELKRKDLGKTGLIKGKPITSDQYLFEISEIKSKLTKQLTTAIKESAFDCSIYSGANCMNFADPAIDKFAFVPDFRDQPSDITTKINKVAVEWKGEIVPINGTDYVSRRMSKNLLNIYDLESYKQGNPRMVGTLEIDADGNVRFVTL